MKLKFDYFKEIFYLLGKDKKKIPILIFFFIFSSLFDLVGIGLIGPYVAIIVKPDSINEISLFNKFEYYGVPQEFNIIIIIFGILLLLIFTMKCILFILINRFILSFSLIRTAILRTWLMERYQSMDLLDYLNRNSSEYIMAVNVFAGAYSLSLKNLLKMTSEGIVFIFIIALLIYTNPYALLLLMIILLIPIGIYDIYSKNKLRYAGEMQSMYNISLIQSINEGIEGIKEIRVFGKELYFRSKVRDITSVMTKYAVRSGILTLVPRHLLEAVLVLFLVTFVLLTVLFGNDITEVVPTIGIFSAAALRLLPTATGITAGIAQLRVHRFGVSVLYKDLFNYPQQVNNGIHDLNINSLGKTNIFNELELTNVSFNYSKSHNPALTNISLKIKKGESIGLIGHSGSGKTTLVNVILGLLKPSKGEIFFNGEPIFNDLPAWLGKIAYLPQDIFLIDEKLVKNIAFGIEDDEIDLEKLDKSIKMAKIHNLVDELPLGLNTVIGERGVRLSGGQRQRIALARAFYHQREIIIMDEATSALDTETEKEIIYEIKRLKGQLTMIIIAHRLSTVKHCDKIFKLDKGRILE